MNDQILSLLVIAFAGAMVVPLALLVRWLEVRGERRRGETTPAE